MTDSNKLREDTANICDTLPSLFEVIANEYYAGLKMKRSQRTALRRYGKRTLFEIANNRPYDFGLAMARAELESVARKPHNHLTAIRCMIDLAAGNLGEIELRILEQQPK